MKVKAFEIRDKVTFIPAVGVLMVPNYLAELGVHAASDREGAEAEGFLLRRAGYGMDSGPLVLLARMEASGIDRNATYDPYAWGPGTMETAHRYIQEHWDELPSGAVICTEHIRGERPEPKPSERNDHE